MRLIRSINLVPLATTILVLIGTQASSYAPEALLQNSIAGDNSKEIGVKLFMELEELSRLVDISYCVGNTGVWKPFRCASRCNDFPGHELVDVRFSSSSSMAPSSAADLLKQTWNTGPLLSDSCGYVALDHTQRRIIVAFRGTYSIANTIVDLTTVPQEYVPYPADPDEPEHPGGGKDRPKLRLPDWRPRLPKFGWGHVQNATEDMKSRVNVRQKVKCTNCTVHMGFLRSWENTRPIVLKHVLEAKAAHPDYDTYLVGHSLGGAVAALAGLELEIKGLAPIITTFGEPRLGNSGLRDYLDAVFELNSDDGKRRFRRVTHKDDPVPLLPLTEWGYKMHAGEIYIAKKHLSPEISDIHHCQGDEDTSCIAAAEFQGTPQSLLNMRLLEQVVLALDVGEDEMNAEDREIPARMRMWEFLFGHRDYFWRLGLCVPGGDPKGWLRKPYDEGREKMTEAMEQDL